MDVFLAFEENPHNMPMITSVYFDGYSLTLLRLSNVIMLSSLMLVMHTASATTLHTPCVFCKPVCVNMKGTYLT